jgi:hypothetical protein
LGNTDRGIELRAQDPKRYVSIDFSDQLTKLQYPICQELILDGLSLNSAMRIVLQIGGISPVYLNIPDEGFPPYPGGVSNILGKGTGLNPRWRYTPESTPIQIIHDLLQSQGALDVVHNVTVPIYLSVSPSGGISLIPFNPINSPVYSIYSTVYTSGSYGFPPNLSYYSSGSAGEAGYGMTKIIGEVAVYNSIEQLRSEITLQGQDFNSYELLNMSRRLDYNLQLIGFRKPWLERSPKFGSDEMMAATMNVASWQASLGSQIIEFDIPFDPNLFPGYIIGVFDQLTLGGIYYFNIISMDSILGAGDPSGIGNPNSICISHIRARNIEAYII